MAQTPAAATAHLVSEQAKPATGSELIAPRFWLLIALTGVAAGLAGGLMLRGLALLVSISFGNSHTEFLASVEAASPLRRILILLLAGAIAGVVLTILRLRRDRPMENISHAGEQPHRSEIESLIRALLSIVIVGMGAALGREGALKQVGSSIAGAFSHLFHISDRERKVLIACGAGAGMAAAYNVPLGGALLAAEILVGSFEPLVLLAALTAACLATATSWLLLPNETAYLVQPIPFSTSLTIWALVAGPFLGLISVAYVRFVHWSEDHAPDGRIQFIAPPIAFGLLGLMAIRFPELMGNGKDVVQLAYLNRTGIGLLAVLALLRPFATAICLRSGAPGGLFTPTMTLGALLGGLSGTAWTRYWPLPGPGACAVAGSAGLLAAATLAPISSLIFVIEMTERIDGSTFPLLVCVAGATLTARLLHDTSIYSE